MAGSFPNAVVPGPAGVHCGLFIAIMPPQVIVYFQISLLRRERGFLAGRVDLSPSHIHANHRHCFQVHRHGTQAVLITGNQTDAAVTPSQMQNYKSNSPLDRSHDF